MVLSSAGGSAALSRLVWAEPCRHRHPGVWRSSGAGGSQRPLKSRHI